MSNYIKSTNFTAKDTLPTGNANKVVRGSELDTEYSAIAVAISTKADTTSPTFTGTPLAPTATAGANNTQIATTAFVQQAATVALQAVYPVGSIYINATSATNPSTLIGFGTWQSFGAGRVLVGFDSSNTLFDTAEETGGSANAVVVSHTHTASTSSAGSHQHFTVNNDTGTGAAAPSTSNYIQRAGVVSGAAGLSYAEYALGASSSVASVGLTSSAGAHTHTVTVDSQGSSGVNANYQPYITVYMWKRVS